MTEPTYENVTAEVYPTVAEVTAEVYGKPSASSVPIPRRAIPRRTRSRGLLRLSPTDQRLFAILGGIPRGRAPRAENGVRIMTENIPR